MQNETWTWRCQRCELTGAIASDVSGTQRIERMLLTHQARSPECDPSFVIAEHDGSPIVVEYAEGESSSSAFLLSTMGTQQKCTTGAGQE